MTDQTDTTPRRASVITTAVRTWIDWMMLCLAALTGNVRETFYALAPKIKVLTPAAAGIAVALVALWLVNAWPDKASMPKLPSYTTEAQVDVAIADAELRISERMLTKDELLRVRVELNATKAALLDLSARMAKLEVKSSTKKAK